MFKTLAVRETKPPAGVSAATGIDWGKVLAEIASPRDDHAAWGLRRYVYLGPVERLCPSGRSWGLGSIGPEGCIDVAAARVDLDWIEQVEIEARRLGLRLGVPDDGDVLFVCAELVPALVFNMKMVICEVSANDRAWTSGQALDPSAAYPHEGDRAGAL